MKHVNHSDSATDTEEVNPYKPNGSTCPFRKNEWGKVAEQPFFNPKCKKCQDCMSYNDSPLQCPITKQKCFGGDVIDE